MGGAVAAHSTSGDGIPGLAGLVVMDVVEGGFQLFRSFSRYFRPFSSFLCILLISLRLPIFLCFSLRFACFPVLHQFSYFLWAVYD